MGVSLDNLNPFTGFGLLDSAIDHASAKDIQHRGFDFDREMFDKQVSFSKEFSETQYNRYLEAIRKTPSLHVSGLREAGLNPILAASGGFQPSSGSIPSVPSITSGRSGSSGGTRSQVATQSREGFLAKKTGKVLDAQYNTVAQQGWLNSANASKAMAEAEKIKAETLRTQYENIKREKIADIYSSEFGTFMVWAQETGLDKVAVAGALALGALGLTKFLGETLYKAPNPFVKGSKNYKIFENARKREEKY